MEDAIIRHILKLYKTRPDAVAVSRCSSSARFIIPASEAVRTSTFRALKPKTSDLRMESSSRYSRGRLKAASGHRIIAVPNRPLLALPERYRLQSLLDWRGNTLARRALEQELNADTRGQFPPESYPSCTSQRGGAPSIQYPLSWAGRRVFRAPARSASRFPRSMPWP